MQILLAFAPFIVFALTDRFVGATPGLVGGALVAAALLARDALSRDRSVKVLEIGTVLLFGGLAIYALVAQVTWSLIGARLWVDGGLLMIVLLSMAIRRPFTLQYARENVPRELWTTPEFVRTNYVITAVWAAAFALIVAADVVMLEMPTVPIRVGIWTTILAIVGATRFTSWYPDRRQSAPAASSE